MNELIINDLIMSYQTKKSVTVKITGYARISSKSETSVTGKLMIKTVHEKDGESIFAIANDITRHEMASEMGIACFDKYGLTYLADTFFEITAIDILPNYTIDDFVKLGIRKNDDKNNISSLLSSSYDDLALYKVASAYATKPSLLTWVLSLISTYRFYNLSVFFYVINFVKNHHSLVSMLSKNIVNYRTIEDLKALSNEIKTLVKNNGLLTIAKKFNTAQRKMMVDRITSGKMGNNDMITLHKIKSMKPEFIRNIIMKVSPITEYEEMFRQLRIFTKFDYDWDYDDFIDFTLNKENNELNYDVTYQDPALKVVVIKVNDYKTMSVIGRKTSWCISRYETSWYDYVIDNWIWSTSQYVLFDFKKDSCDKNCMVAFTTNFNGSRIVNAHNFMNTSILYTKESGGSSGEKGLIPISEIIYGQGLTLSKIIGKPVVPCFNWDLDSFVKYANNNGIEGIGFDKEKNICLVKLSMIGSTMTFDMLFENHTFLSYHPSDLSSHDGVSYMLLLDFNRSLDERGFVQMVRVKKSIYGDDLICDSTDYNGFIGLTDVFGALYGSSINGTIIRLTMRNVFDLIKYYHIRGDVGEEIRIVKENDSPFSGLLSTNTSLWMVFDIFQDIMDTSNIDLIQKSINDESFVALSSNMNCESTPQSIIDSAISMVLSSCERGVNNSCLKYVLEIIFGFVKSRLDNDVFYSRSNFMASLMRVALKNEEIGGFVMSYYQDNKLYDKKIMLRQDLSNNYEAVNYFNLLLIKRLFSDAMSLINAEVSFNTNVTGINTHTYDILKKYRKDEPKLKGITVFNLIWNYVITKLNIYSKCN